MTDLVEEMRRAVLGDQHDAPAPKVKTYEDHVREVIEAERLARRAEAKPVQPSMAEFAQQEREKLRPRLQRTELILYQAAAYGYGSEQRRR